MSRAVRPCHLALAQPSAGRYNNNDAARTNGRIIRVQRSARRRTRVRSKQKNHKRVSVASVVRENSARSPVPRTPYKAATGVLSTGDGFVRTRKTVKISFWRVHVSDTIGGVLRCRWAWVRLEFKEGEARDQPLLGAVKFGNGGGKFFNVHFLLLQNFRKIKIVFFTLFGPSILLYIYHPSSLCIFLLL